MSSASSAAAPAATSTLPLRPCSMPPSRSRTSPAAPPSANPPAALLRRCPRVLFQSKSPSRVVPATGSTRAAIGTATRNAAPFSLNTFPRATPPGEASSSTRLALDPLRVRLLLLLPALDNAPAREEMAKGPWKYPRHLNVWSRKFLGKPSPHHHRRLPCFLLLRRGRVEIKSARRPIPLRSLHSPCRRGPIQVAEHSPARVCPRAEIHIVNLLLLRPRRRMPRVDFRSRNLARVI